MQKTHKNCAVGAISLLTKMNESVLAVSAAAILATLATAGTAPANEVTAMPATKPDRLIVRTWGGPWRSSYEAAAAASFTAKTGIPVEFDVTDFNEIQVKVGQAVSAKARPPVDVVLTIETMAYAALPRSACRTEFPGKRFSIRNTPASCL